MGRKHCGKRRNCSLRAISPFPTKFSKGLFPRGVKRCHCVGRGLLRASCMSSYIILYGSLHFNLNCWKYYYFEANKAVAENQNQRYFSNIMAVSAPTHSYPHNILSYACFPGVHLTRTLSKPLDAFPYNQCRTNGQQRERNESHHNDYHQSSERILAEPLDQTSNLLFQNPVSYRQTYGDQRQVFQQLPLYLHYILLKKSFAYLI